MSLSIHCHQQREQSLSNIKRFAECKERCTALATLAEPSTVYSRSLNFATAVESFV